MAADSSGILQLPPGVIAEIVSLLPLQTTAALQCCKDLLEQTEAALAARTSYWSSDQRELSHLKATRLFRYLARRCPSLKTISVCYAADRLYGGSLLDSSLGALFAGVPYLAHLTLLNVDVTDAVMQQLARQCPLLQHLAIGRTENNAFGNFVSDAGLRELATACPRLDSLCLFRCYSCSDAGLEQLTANCHLTNLVLHSCPQVTAAGLVKLIEATPMLQQLDVLMPEAGPGGAAVTFNTCFALAAQCPTLKVLRLSEEQLSGGVLDDSCVLVIARGCTQLQELELVQVEVSDAAMAVLAAHCTQLTSLRLEQTYVGDEGVQKLLAACPLLQELRVAGCSTHSWMLPAEYMFAGLSVSGLSRMAAAPGVGAALTSLDLSCLAYEQPLAQPPAAAVMQELLPGAVAAVAAVTAAVAAAGEVPVAAGSAVAASTAAALLSSSPTPSSSVGSSASSSAMIGSDDGSSSSSSSFTSVASAIARLSLDSSSSSSSRSSSTSSSPVRKSSWDGSTSSSSSHLLQPMQPTTYSHQHGSSPSSTCSAVGDPGNSTIPQKSSPSTIPASTDLMVHPPLIPVDWCGRLVSLSLDWLKVDGSMLQGPLEATLRACGSLKRLSLVGYSGDVDGLLGCVVDAGAAVTQLGLQHSQVTDAGLAVAATRMPGLKVLYISYCRQIGDPGLEQVLRMGSLEELDLYNTPCVSAAAVARIARYSRSLRRLYIGHNTSALNRTPAQTTAMGYICSGDRSKYTGGTSSVWAAVSEAAACRIGGQQLSVLCRNPSSNSDFEKRTLQQLLAGEGVYHVGDIM